MAKSWGCTRGTERGWRIEDGAGYPRTILHLLSSILAFLTSQEHHEALNGLTVVATAQRRFATGDFDEAGGSGETLYVRGGLGVTPRGEQAQIALIF